MNTDLSVEQPEAPENLPLGSEEEPADPTPEVPENPRSTEPEIPAYGVAHPQDHQDAELETGQPDDAELQQLAVHGFANQADPEDEESSSPRPEGDKLDYASLLREALDDPMEQMRQSFKNHVADYMQESILLTQLYGTY